MSDWSASFIAVDWGTTNRRAYLLDASGRVVADMEDDQGVTAIPPGGFAAAVDAIRQRLGDHPMLLAGMIGSNRGWCEAAYVACPADLGRLAEHVVALDGAAPLIVPGLSYVEGARGDVMRGEEVQIFGLMAMEGAPQGLTVCHPGTHTKWATTSSDTITGFRTVMTGELFALLREHSILAPLLAGKTQTGDVFLSGIDKGFAGCDLAAELFSLRAGVLLNLLPSEEALPLANGLMIGADLRAGLAWSGAEEEIIVLGNPSLTKLYAAGLQRVGRRCRSVDGATAFAAGMHAIRGALA